MTEINSKLNELIEPFPSLYQPIYGHHEFDHKVERSCDDRLTDIKKIYDNLSVMLQRPLRVLDIGCNLCYISLTICSWGGEVSAVDANKKFLEVGEFLASEHPDFKIQFFKRRIENFISTIKNDEYDLVLGYSVFHHVTKQIGFQSTQKLLTDLAEKIPVGLFELAIEKEFRKKIKLPANYREFLEGYFFVRVLKYYSWGSKRNFQRPLCFASNKYAHFDDLGVLKIDKIPRKDRKHFICGDKFVKVLYSKKQEISKKAQNEIDFLQKFGGQNGLPKLQTTLQETDEAGTKAFIIIDNINGSTLPEKLSKASDEDKWDIVEELLRWMIFFEKQGYYQKDLVLSNFICDESGKIIPIDYELMIHDPISHRWPFNLRLQFIGLMNTILTKKGDKEIPLIVGNSKKYYFRKQLLTSLSQYISADKCRWILALYDNEKFFENLYEILFSSPNFCISRPFTISEVEVLEKEQYLQDLCLVANSHEDSIKSLLKMVSQQQKQIEQLEKIIRENNQ